MSLYKALRNHGNNPRIFISNHLPKVGEIALQRGSISRSNFTLQQAIRSTGRMVGGIFELTLHKHFTTHRRERVLRPVDRYFRGNSQLTPPPWLPYFLWVCDAWGRNQVLLVLRKKQIVLSSYRRRLHEELFRRIGCLIWNNKNITNAHCVAWIVNFIDVNYFTVHVNECMNPNWFNK